MNDRPCEQCVWHSSDGCTKWDCVPLTRSQLAQMLENDKADLRRAGGRV